MNDQTETILIIQCPNQLKKFIKHLNEYLVKLYIEKMDKQENKN